MANETFLVVESFSLDGDDRVRCVFSFDADVFARVLKATTRFIYERFLIIFANESLT